MKTKHLILMIICGIISLSGLVWAITIFLKCIEHKALQDLTEVVVNGKGFEIVEKY